MMVGLDTNVLVRYIMQDDAVQSAKATALIESLEGKRGIPRNRPPFPVTHGFLCQPTGVNNVETLAHVALVGRFGPEWYGAGTTLVTLAGAVAQPGVHEVPLGGSIGELLDSCGGVTAELAGVLVGGYFGRFVVVIRNR